MTTTKSDCGCHDSGALAAKSAGTPGKAPRTVFVPRDAAAAAESGTFVATATSDAATNSSTVVVDGFRALNPQDGLFLRAEHLAAIQDYSRALTGALATANGAGVVHGLGVTIIGKKLVISPGLAISPRGRLLLLSAAVSIPLDDDHLPALPVDGFWKIELHWAWDTSGSAPVYGSLCADECADGSATIRPWREEGVEIRISPDGLERFDAVPPHLRGNWLASAYFERERRNAGAWLVPFAADRSVPSLGSHDWTNDTSLPAEQGVPLAVLYTAQRAAAMGQYRLQVWTARRLVDGPAAHAAWRSRLAMRPWAVFLAQILQFEAELTGIISEFPGPEGALIMDLGALHQLIADARTMFEGTGQFINSLKPTDPTRNRKEFAAVAGAWEKFADNPLASATTPRVPEQLGLDELPPAGYLPMNEYAEDVAFQVRSFFGEAVDVRVRAIRADQAADEILAAQHRDRIPLRPVDGRRPKVDVLLPTELADKRELSARAYGWVAFVRRGPDDVDEPRRTDEVDVYVRAVDEVGGFEIEIDGPGDIEFNVTDLDAFETGLQEPTGIITLPEGGTWSDSASTVAEETLKVIDFRRGFQPVVLVALTHTDRPLAGVRAGLFGISIDSGLRHLPLHAYDGRPIDAIVVLVAKMGNG